MMNWKAVIIVLSFAYLATAFLGVDVSSSVSVSDWNCLKQQGYTYAIVRAWRSTGGPDPEAPQTVKNAVQAGIAVDVYFFPDYAGGNPANQVQQCHSFLSSNGIQYGTIWFDIEQPPDWGNCAENSNFLSNLTSTAQSLGMNIGIYVSANFWNQMLCGTKNFGNIQLWYADWDNNPSFSGFSPFGGWSSPVMKQYVGNANACGVGIDENYRSTNPSGTSTTTSPKSSSSASKSSSGPASSASSGPSSSASSGPSSSASSGPSSSGSSSGTGTSSASSGTGTSSASSGTGSSSASSASSATSSASSGSSSASSSATTNTGTSGSSGNIFNSKKLIRKNRFSPHIRKRTPTRL